MMIKYITDLSCVVGTLPNCDLRLLNFIADNECKNKG